MTQDNNRSWLRYLLLFLVLTMLATLACQTLFGESDDDMTRVFEEIEPSQDAAEVDSEIAEEVDQAGAADETEASEEESQSIELPESSDTTEEDTSEEASSEEAPNPTAEPVEDSSAEQEEETPQDEGLDRPSSDVGSLILGQYGFIQQTDGIEVAYAFHIENPDPDFGIQDSEYQVAVFDEAGTVLETDFGYLNLVLPSENTAVSGAIWLDDGLRAAEIEIQLKSGEPVQLESYPLLAVHSPRYFGDDFSERGTGILESQYDEYMEDVIVSFVTYDESGIISGSGYTYVDWVDPHETIGTESYLTTNGNVDQIVMYPRTSFFSVEPAYGSLPEGASKLILVSSGFVWDEDGLSYGLLIANENDDFAIENGRYVVSAFSTNGTVLFSESGYLDLIPPSGTVVDGGYEFLDTDEEIDFLDFQIRAGNFIESGPIPPLTADNVSYLDDDLFPTVTGQITNPFDWDLESVRVWAVLYNEAGEFIGGGYDYVSFIPANGTAAAEVYVDGLRDPASVELVAALEYFDDTTQPEE